MSIVKPSIPKGTRDFQPLEMMKRNYIFNTIKSVFEKYAYLPIETPSMENLSTLMGKYEKKVIACYSKSLTQVTFYQELIRKSTLHNN